MSDGKSQTIHEPCNKFYRDADDIVLRGLATPENEAMRNPDTTQPVALRGASPLKVGDRVRDISPVLGFGRVGRGTGTIVDRDDVFGATLFKVDFDIGVRRTVSPAWLEKEKADG